MNKEQKTLQKKENAIVKRFLTNFEKKHGTTYYCPSNQLRSCQARVFHYGDYEILRSYNTIVAIYDRKNNAVYDFLRYVYGYTNSSSRQIQKFKSDYIGWNKGTRHYTFVNV